jgi:hypothetical protein
MSTTIWKFTLELTDLQGMEMPSGARILTVAAQGSSVCLWAHVDPEAPRETRTIRLYGTGHPMPENPGVYLGTFQMAPLVFHAFEPST